ncbi:MAG: ATP-binding cassette domain-containing protein [Alphaproteobacteria bacterium]
MREKAPAVEILGAELAYPSRQDRPVFCSLNLRIEALKSIGISGRSGSGKSSLALMIAGFVRPTAGSLRIFGQEVTRSRDGTVSSSRLVNILFQDPVSSINPARTLGEWMSLGVHAGVKAEDISASLAAVHLNECVLKRRPSEVSGGECQRLQIAKIICSNAPIVILDECVSMLDVISKKIISNVIIDNIRSKKTLIAFSHDAVFLRSIAELQIDINSISNTK